VLDEADRLLSQAYHHWVRSILSASEAAPNLSHSFAHNAGESSTSKDPYRMRSFRAPHVQRTAPVSSDAIACDGLGLDFRITPLQRLLFSATLTDNPSHLALLGLHVPLIICAGGDVSGPEDTPVPDSVKVRRCSSIYVHSVEIAD
jgi:superfamily II DNA/RNA helicase